MKTVFKLSLTVFVLQACLADTLREKRQDGASGGSIGDMFQNFFNSMFGDDSDTSENAVNSTSVLNQTDVDAIKNVLTKLKNASSVASPIPVNTSPQPVSQSVSLAPTPNPTPAQNTTQKIAPSSPPSLPATTQSQPPDYVTDEYRTSTYTWGTTPEEERCYTEAVFQVDTLMRCS